MAKISIKDVISTGYSESMIGTAGSPGLGRAWFNGSMEFSIIVLDNGETFLKFIKGYATRVRSTVAEGLVYRNGSWPVLVIAGPNAFVINVVGPKKTNYTISGSSTNDFGWHGVIDLSNKLNSNTYGTGTWDTSESATDLSEGSTASASVLLSAGYVKVMDLEDWPNSSATISYYAAALVAANEDDNVASTITLNAGLMTINAETNPKLFNYYPWERYAGGSSGSGGNVDVETGGSGGGDTSITQPGSGSSSSGWVSLNRNGASTDSSGLHRMDGSWVRETNKQGQDSSEDHVHRYNSGWVKSQKV